MSIKQKTIILLGVICMAVANYSRAGNGYNLLPQYVIYEKAENTFTIVENKKATDIYVDPSDWKGVRRAVTESNRRHTKGFRCFCQTQRNCFHRAVRNNCRNDWQKVKSSTGSLLKKK